MEPYMPHVLAFSAILAYIALGIVLLRFRGARSPIVIMLIASLVPYGSFLLLSKPLDMLHYTATYFFGLMCFLFFWGGLFKSISVRIICDLLEEETRTLIALGRDGQPHTAEGRGSSPIDWNPV